MLLGRIFNIIQDSNSGSIRFIKFSTLSASSAILYHWWSWSILLLSSSFSFSPAGISPYFWRQINMHAIMLFFVASSLSISIISPSVIYSFLTFGRFLTCSTISLISSVVRSVTFSFAEAPLIHSGRMLLQVPALSQWHSWGNHPVHSIPPMFYLYNS